MLSFADLLLSVFLKRTIVLSAEVGALSVLVLKPSWWVSGRECLCKMQGGTLPFPVTCPGHPGTAFARALWKQL